MAEDNTPLQIDCTITRIATVAAGGWNLTVHIPEVFAPQVKPLIGHENKTQFVLVLVEAGKIEKTEKEEKCQSSRKHLTFTK